MRISKAWLNDFIDFSDLSADDFASLITTRVAEVDSILTVAAPMDEAIVAYVKSVRPHPSLTKLKIATVSLGSCELDVVCGAPNISEGMLSVYLPSGAKVVVASASDCQTYKDVLDRDFSGVISKGVLVSEAELGLTDVHDGICDLEALVNEVLLNGSKVNLNQIVPGVKLKSIFSGADTILEIDNKSLTHRPDLWSHFGFAREISAILRRPLKDNIDRFADDNKSGVKLFQALSSGRSRYRVEIQEGCGCRRFSVLEFDNVKITSSPLWMRRRLFSIGAGVRNLLVDLSNYVMHDLGQPNHAYDARLLNGKTIFVRFAMEGEKFRGLDGEERELNSQDIVIADEKGVIALGGVIGGERSSIANDTTSLLLESANFNPTLVRKTTKRHALRTDASNRFEKSISAYAVPLAIQRFWQILNSQLPDAKIQGRVFDCFSESPKIVSVPVHFDYIRQRLGVNYDDGHIGGILLALGFGEKKKKAGVRELHVPYYRATRDISIAEDIVEEVGRITGYENVPECAPSIQSVASKSSAISCLECDVQECLSALGFSETYQYSFMSAERAQILGYDVSKTIVLKNPVDVNCDRIRNTLVPGIIEHVERNARFQDSTFLYEIGRAYELCENISHKNLKLKEKYKDAVVSETRLLAFAYVSGRQEAEMAFSLKPELKKGADFYAALAVAKRVCRLASISELDVKPIEVIDAISLTSAVNFRAYKKWMHPYRCASLNLKGIPIGVIAEVMPSVLSNVKGRVILFEIDLELLLEADSKTYLFKPIAKFPDSMFEISIVMPKTVCFAEIKNALSDAVGEQLLKTIEVVSVYEGNPLADNEKSVSVKLVFGAKDKTLSSVEVKGIQDKVVDTVSCLGYSLRT